MAARPPGPPGLPLLGNILDFRRDTLGFLSANARVHGDVSLYRLGRADVFLLRHPDDIRDVLVTHQHSFAKGKGIQWAKLFLGEGLLTSEGEFHTRQRRLAQPAFHRQRIATYAEAMTAEALVCREGIVDGQVLDIHAAMMGLTLAVAAKTLFDADVRTEARDIAEALSVIIGLFPRFAIPFASVINRLPLPANARFARAVALLDGIVYRIIAERRASGEDRGDLLSMLLVAVDEEGDGARMTDRQLRDEIMTILLAGHETTANALTWTWYLIARNPAVEARMHAEVDRALGGRPPTAADLPALGYVERVFAESMRLYPPAWGLGRRALAAYSVRGFTLRSGGLVAMSPYVVQRDERWWPDPLRFDPDRFLPEAKAARPRFAYFPFGGGARQCIGESFAWMEGVLLLSALAQRWAFRLAPGPPVVPQALITLRPKHGIAMRAEARRPAGVA
jgi:cytochrome P450